MTTFFKLCNRILMIIVLDISPSDRTIYLTEPTIEVLISFFTLPATASRSIFYLYRIRIPFHPKHQPFTLKGSHFLLHNFLLDDLTYQYLKSYWRHLKLYISYFIHLQSLLFFFFVSNPVIHWTNDHLLFLSMTAGWYQTVIVLYICTSLAQPQMHH